MPFRSNLDNDRFWEATYILEKSNLLPKMRIRHKKAMEKLYNVIYPQITECAICGCTISGSNLQLDHDHETGLFRGWLCMPCNQHLGIFERRHIEFEKYLERGWAK